MPYNWNGDYDSSKADESTDILGQKEIGGVGQFIYYPFRYKDYILANDREEYCAFIGGKTMTITYQEKDFCSNDSHNLALYLKDTSKRQKYIQCFIVSALRKTLGIKYYWGDSISKKKIQSDTVFLPVNEKNVIDYDYMDKYIKAIEKKVITDIVKYKNSIIQITKDVEND